MAAMASPTSSRCRAFTAAPATAPWAAAPRKPCATSWVSACWPGSTRSTASWGSALFDLTGYIRANETMVFGPEKVEPCVVRNAGGQLATANFGNNDRVLLLVMGAALG